MATNYSTIVKEVALRINGIAGAQVATVETNYASATMTTTQLDNPRYPPAAIKDAVLDTEAMVAQAIANTKNHLWRWYMLEVSDFINNTDRIPVESAFDIAYIGQLEQPYDASGGRRLEEAEYEDVRAYNAASGYFGTNPYIFAYRGGLIFHTLPNSRVKLFGCQFSRSARATLLASNGAILFPDVAVPLYVAGAVSLLTRDGEYSGQAAVYRKYFEDGLNQLAAGETNFRQFVPEPPAVAKASV